MHHVFNRKREMILLSMLIVTALTGYAQSASTKGSSDTSPNVAEYDKKIKIYTSNLPDLMHAISEITPLQLHGDINKLNDLDHHRKEALETLQTVSKDAHDVLASHKIYDELQLMYDVGMLSQIVSILTTDIAAVIDHQDNGKQAQCFKWLMDLEKGDTAFSFEQTCYSYLLTRARAIDMKP